MPILTKAMGFCPKTLFEAAQAMKNSKIANDLFGEKFTQHFSNTRLWEWNEYMAAISDWEIKRYLEII